jgi:hypothetical protein
MAVGDASTVVSDEAAWGAAAAGLPLPPPQAVSTAPLSRIASRRLWDLVKLHIGISGLALTDLATK